jgi:hypothetical protein
MKRKNKDIYDAMGCKTDPTIYIIGVILILLFIFLY